MTSAKETIADAPIAHPPESGVNTLAASAAAGDTTAFEALVQRHKRMVLAVGRRMTGSIDDAEDIAQQTFMKAFSKLSMFRGDCSFSTWLMSIAINEARMWIRKRCRCREVPALHTNTEEDTAIALEIPDLRPDPESLYSKKERDALLSAKLNRLRLPTRRALELCDLQEQSTSRTARLLGITVSAVKSRRSRGRAQLRTMLAYHLSPGQLNPKSEGRHYTSCTQT